MMTETRKPTYQFRVTLRGLEPPVWRRLQLYRHQSFYSLHLTLQAAMGWLNYHLHQFRVGKLTLADRESLEEWTEWREGFSGVDHYEARLMDHVREVGTVFTYEYDFGDSWEHELVLEAVLPVEQGADYPRCLDGARATPPEDVGRIWGYERFIEAIRSPDDQEHEEYLAWAVSIAADATSAISPSASGSHLGCARERSLAETNSLYTSCPRVRRLRSRLIPVAVL